MARPLLRVCANISQGAMEDRDTLRELTTECELLAELRPLPFLSLLFFLSEGEYDVRLRLVVSLVGLTSANPGTIGELRTRLRPKVDQSPGAARRSMDLDSLTVVSWAGESDPSLSTSQTLSEMAFARGILRSPRLLPSTVCLRVLGLKLRGRDSESSMSKYELGFSRILWSML